MSNQEVPIRDFYTDPNATHLEPRWWHKFVFWREFKYPKYVVERRCVSLEELDKK